MSVEAWLGYVLALTILAVTPGPGWAVVVTTSLARGTLPGIAMSIGIAVGDVALMLVAVLGMAVLAANLGSLFVIVKLCGAAYLIWLGMKFWRDVPKELHAQPSNKRVTAALLSGVALTLGNAKAIAFYVGFLPAFFDMSILTVSETLLLAVTTLVVIATVLSGCAVLAARSSILLRNQTSRRCVGRVVGSLLIGIGLVIAAR